MHPHGKSDAQQSKSVVVRNTLVGRLRPRSARGRLQTKPERHTTPPLHKMSAKYVENFLNYFANKQTNKIHKCMSDLMDAVFIVQFRVLFCPFGYCVLPYV